MSLRINFALVRFSDIEKIHYFYDPVYPSAIQFALNGQWESWDVGWVRHYAHDPEIKRIAADAEASLINLSTYHRWRSTPMPSPTSVTQPIESSTSSQNAPAEHPLSPLSPGAARDASFPPANGSPLPSFPQPDPVFSPGPTPSATSDEYEHFLPPLNTAVSNHNAFVPVSAAAASPSLHTTATLPLSSHPSATAAPLTIASMPPSAPTPATYISPPHTAHRAHYQIDHCLPSVETNPNIDPHIYAAEANPNVSPTIPNGVDREPVRPPDTSSPPDSNPLHHRELRLKSIPPLEFQPLLSRADRTFKVNLSLDGDGIRGLSQVLLVEALVHSICTKLNRNMEPYEIFDLIGGSSMGGLLTLMLSRLRMSVVGARNAYKRIAPEVFQNKMDYFSSFDSLSGRFTYDAQALEGAIKKVVSEELPHVDERLLDSRPDSANAFVVTTQVKQGTNKAAVLRSYQTSRVIGPEIDDGVLVWQAMKAAVVAPRYTTPQNGVVWRPIIEPGLIDYGTAKNNPVGDVYYECSKLCRHNMLIIVSIGTGAGLNPDLENPKMANHIYERLEEGDSRSRTFLEREKHQLSTNFINYFRFNVPNLEGVPLQEWRCEDLIKAKTSEYLADEQVNREFHACADVIVEALVGV